MDNEKNFIIAIILTVAVIIVYPKVMHMFFPQYFAAEKTVSSPSLMPENTTSSVSTTTAADIPTVSATIDTKKTYIISNTIYNVELNARGEIVYIALNTILDPSSHEPTILLNLRNAGRGIAADRGLTDRATVSNVITDDDVITIEFVRPDGVLIRKIISLTDEKLFKIHVAHEITNSTDRALSMGYRIVAAAAPTKASGIEGRFRENVILFEPQRLWKKNIGGAAKETLQRGKARIAGIREQYFSLLMLPNTESQGVYNYQEDAINIIGFEMKPGVIDPQGVVKHEFVIFAGPSQFEEMAALGIGVEDIRDSGILAGFSEFLLLLLRLFYTIFRNYGIAVIALALVINLCLYPLTAKSFKAMKDMQVLQPKIEELRTVHKDNPQKLNKEVMELYKKHKVNPAGGCLPLILQMPVFISLYGVLMHAIELRGASFLWINNLAAPDAVITFASPIPLIGSSLNLLPLIMAVLMFFQQKKTSTGAMNEQQKVMTVTMPVVFAFIFYNFPSGLALYFLTNSVFSFALQVAIAREKQ